MSANNDFKFLSDYYTGAINFSKVRNLLSNAFDNPAVIRALNKRGLMPSRVYNKIQSSKSVEDIISMPGCLEVLYALSYDSTVNRSQRFYMLELYATIFNANVPVIRFDCECYSIDEESDLLAFDLAEEGASNLLRQLGHSTCAVWPMYLEERLFSETRNGFIAYTIVNDAFYLFYVDTRKKNVLYFRVTSKDGDYLCLLRSFQYIKNKPNEVQVIEPDGAEIMNYLLPVYRAYQSYKNEPTAVIEEVSLSTPKPAKTDDNDSPLVPKILNQQLIKYRYVDMSKPKVKSKYVYKGGHHARPVEHIRHYQMRILKDGTVREPYEVVINKGVTKQSKTITVYKDK